jgi:Flp pilus assembly protein TadB
MTRVGDPERERTAQALRRHYVEGRLDVTELSERLDLVLRARSRRELRVALGQLPRWSDVEHLAARARHGGLVAVVTVVWLMLSATLLVTFLAWVAAHGPSLGALLAFPIVWLVLSALLYRRTAVSRQRLHHRS